MPAVFAAFARFARFAVFATCTQNAVSVKTLQLSVAMQPDFP